MSASPAPVPSDASSDTETERLLDERDPLIRFLPCKGFFGCFAREGLLYKVGYYATISFMFKGFLGPNTAKSVKDEMTSIYTSLGLVAALVSGLTFSPLVSPPSALSAASETDQIVGTLLLAFSFGFSLFSVISSTFYYMVMSSMEEDAEVEKLMRGIECVLGLPLFQLLCGLFCTAAATLFIIYLSTTGWTVAFIGFLVGFVLSLGLAIFTIRYASHLITKRRHKRTLNRVVSLLRSGAASDPSGVPRGAATTNAADGSSASTTSMGAPSAGALLRRALTAATTASGSGSETSASKVTSDPSSPTASAAAASAAAASADLRVSVQNPLASSASPAPRTADGASDS